MDFLVACNICFTCQASGSISVPPFKGSMIRGALFSALRQDFCLGSSTRVCSSCDLCGGCPVSSLLATVNEDSSRGVEVARPCTVEPPLDAQTRYRPGERFTFGITLFGDAADMLPYVVLGVRRVGEIGVGSWKMGRGRFEIERIDVVHPLLGRTQEVYRAGQNVVRRPGIAVTHGSILALSDTLDSGAVTLELLTPMRLVSDGVLVKRLTFPIFMRRLLRRLTDLTRTATGGHPGFDHEALLAQAEGVRVVEDRTRWADVPSWSGRQGRFTPIGGLMGEITFEGDLAPFAPWLLWGTITHVGKDATKGGGWYRIQGSGLRVQGPGASPPGPVSVYGGGKVLPHLLAPSPSTEGGKGLDPEPRRLMADH